MPYLVEIVRHVEKCYKYKCNICSNKFNETTDPHKKICEDCYEEKDD